MLARCRCGHGSDCHYASDDGIHECQDCECRSFHWDGGDKIPPDTIKRDWITGRPIKSEDAPAGHERVRGGDYWCNCDECNLKRKEIQDQFNEVFRRGRKG